MRGQVRKRGNNEGSIYQRSDGRWAGAVTLEDGRRKSFYGKTRSEVAGKVNRALTELQQGITPADDRLTVRQYMAVWLEGRKDSLRYATYRDYESRIRLYIDPSLGSVRLSKLTPEQVERMLAKMQEAGLSPRTRQYVHAVLRAALQTAVKRGRIPRNVAMLIDGPSVKREPVKPLTVEEAKTFLAAATEERLLGPLYTVTLGLGLRKGETLGLRWQDVDLEERRLWVRHALQRQKGKGLVLVEPKSRTSRRPLALPPFVVEAFKEQRRRQVEQRLASGPHWQDQDFVFTMPDGRPVSGDYINAKFPKFLKRSFTRCPLCGEGQVHDGHCEKCGGAAIVQVPAITFHGLRHSCASLLFAQGCSLRLVMEILGHSQIALTANTYTHLLPEADREAATAMESVLGADS
ncbi:MAG: site-specific integrase [Actinomycetia bacterium]|nr:site-specific integrase [Actinomycetes bacterium]